MLGGSLLLTDLQLDYAPSGSGPALVALKSALGRSDAPSVKMLVGCHAWPDLRQLEDQLDLGLWRLVDVTSGAPKLAAALMPRAHQRGSDDSMALWEVLWRKSEAAASPHS